MPLPLSALGWDSFSGNVWLGDEVLTSQPCNISICVRQSWQMNPTLSITAWHHMKITAMSSSCQICSCHCDGELSFIICCACLCQLLLTVCIDLQEQRGAEVTLINTLQHTRITPSWHSITWDKRTRNKEYVKERWTSIQQYDYN